MCMEPPGLPQHLWARTCWGQFLARLDTTNTKIKNQTQRMIQAAAAFVPNTTLNTAIVLCRGCACYGMQVHVPLSCSEQNRFHSMCICCPEEWSRSQSPGSCGSTKWCHWISVLHAFPHNSKLWFLWWKYSNININIKQVNCFCIMNSHLHSSSFSASWGIPQEAFTRVEKAETRSRLVL